jgi:ABC-type sugar transport system substrate-binding protein
MKKILASVLAIMMILSFAACGGSTSEAEPSPSPSGSAPASESSAPPSASSSASAPATEETGTVSNEWKPGFYNPDENYSKNERYKIVYMLYQNGVLYDMFDHAFTQWAERANCDYSVWCANADGDLFITSIETFASQGVHGILSDADMTIYTRVNEVMNEVGMPWMPVMGAPRDDTTGKLLHAYCGFDFYMYGEQMANWVIDYYEETWPDAPMEKTAMLCLDFSVSDNLHVRVDAARDIWNARYPGNEDKFYVADGSTGMLNSDTGYNISAPLIAAHPEVEYWIVCGLLDDYADGCARALEGAGKDDKAVITVMGGSGLINHWDAGEESCWKSACYTAETVYAEPIFFGLYDQLRGLVTSDTLWPDWVNKGKGEAYSSLMLPSFFITKDNYQEYMEWCDAYTGINRSDYPYNGTEYSARIEVPASYAG